MKTILITGVSRGIGKALAEKFLNEGHRVKIDMALRGREKALKGFAKEKIAEFLKTTDVSFIIKHRDPATRRVDINRSIIIGDVRGKRILSFDDMCQSADTIVTGALIAKEKGAKEVTVLIVHNDFGVNTFDILNPALENCTIDKMIILETIPLIRANEWHPNLVVLSPAKFIAEVINCVHKEGHMRQFFLPIS